MFRIKNIIILTVFASLLTGSMTVFADTPNDMLRMDIKRSSMNDAVDVTFYTTGNASNTVVTRKGTNRYVVLLPNVSSVSSVVPSLGGVKDLVTDINVKNVDDGIGGYTKVTFTTTKPIKIQTATKRTAPLTQAQQDYKNLIAQNSKYNPEIRMQNFKAKSEVTTPKTVTQTAKSQPTSNEKISNVKKSQNQNTTKSNSTVKSQSEQKVKPNVQNQQTKQLSKNIVHTKQSENNVPVLKQENKAKLGSEQNNTLNENAQKQIENTEKIQGANTSEVKEKQNSVSNNEKSVNNKVKNTNFKKITKFGLASVAGLFLFMILLNIVSALMIRKTRKENYFEENNLKESKSHQQELKNIMEDDSLNWQEKYKRYTESDKAYNNTGKDSKYSFVANMAGEKQYSDFVEEATQQDVSLKNNVSSKPETKEEVIDVVKSQLEHAFNQVNSIEPEDNVKPEVESEDIVISENLSNIKLKAFSKNQNLKVSNRNLLKKENRVASDPLKESKFVKLRNSALSMTRRNSANSDLNISDLLRTGRKYLDNNNNGVVKMSKKEKNYVLSSLDEYLSILNTEDEVKEKTTQNVAKTLSKMKSNDVMSRSGITNPIEKSKNIPEINQETTSKMNGLVVKSGFNIDEEKGIYLVNLDDISALVGRIKDDIFILKKFDKIIDSPLQVRLDYGSVYIAKVGGFKCLVDVSENKMGTLLEI